MKASKHESTARAKSLRSGARFRAVFTAAVTSVVMIIAGAHAANVPLSYGIPTVSGTGAVGTTARFTNVATQDGVDLDMLATVVEAVPAGINTIFSAVNAGDYRFDMGNNSGDRHFKVRYEFFETGTNTPRAVEQMIWSIGDLDKTSSRTEGVVVQGALAYILEDPTTLTVVQSGDIIDVDGTVDLDEDEPDGNPEGLVSFFFVEQQSFEITYRVVGGGGGYFDHVADGNFAFVNADGNYVGKSLYYTFSITNDEEVSVGMDFTNTLPGDLKWDPAYTPVTSAGVVIAPDMMTVSGDGKTMEISDFPVPPGVGTFTLRTETTNLTGLIFNEATAMPSVASGYPRVGLHSASSMTLPVPPELPPPPPGPAPLIPIIDDYVAGGLCGHAWFTTGGDLKESGHKSTAEIKGDVAIGPGGSHSVSSGVITGTLTRDPTATGVADSIVDYSAAAAAAVAMSGQLAALPATQTIADSGDNLVIGPSGTGGLHVVDIAILNISSGGSFTINGSANDWFVINVTDTFELNGNSSIGGSVDPSHVIFNVPGTLSKPIKISGNSQAFAASILAPFESVSIRGGAGVGGQVISMGGDINEGSTLHRAFTWGGGGCDP